MKKRIALLLCIAVVLVLALASCETECAHTFSDDWSSDATNHWHAATCEHGEIKDSQAAHTDSDEDGACDVCAYDLKHTHTYAAEWSSDETNHWKAATCSHKDEKGELSLHLDDNTDGKCDVCTAHVHTLDGAGFCTGCNKEIKPVDEFDIASVISATTARTHNVIGILIDRYAESRNPSNPADNLILEHVAEVKRGTNGTYIKWIYDEVKTEVDENGNDVAVKTGKDEILEKWIKLEADNTVSGFSAISVDGVYKSAEPNPYSADDLAGYYFSVSSFADGHGAEALLLAIYEAYVEYGTEEATIVWDDENNKYDFSFGALVVDKTTSGGVDLHEYSAYYYEVKVSFTYADDYTLTSLDVECNCYTSDDTLKYPDGTLAQPDFDYNYETGEFTMRDVTNPAKYTYSVTQTVGTRGEIQLNDGSEFIPDGYVIYADADHTAAMPESLTISITDMSQVMYLAPSSNGFMSFLIFDFDIIVADKDGNPAPGLQVVAYGYDEIWFMPLGEGEYVVTFEALGQTETIDVTVEAPEVMGENFITVEVLDSYSWSDGWTDEGVWYEFKPKDGAYGVYTFYLPANFGMAEVNQWENNHIPNADYYDNEHRTVTVTIRPGQVFRFYFAATVAGTYTIGYDAP